MVIPTYLIAKDFTSNDYKALSLDTFPHQDWQKAVDAFSLRFTSRFFNPLVPLAGSPTNSESVNGFIILSCTFILVETLGGFRKGVGNHKGKSETLFTTGLEGLPIEKVNGDVFEATELQKKSLYKIGRCAVLHTAGTENIKVRSSGPVIKETDNEGFEINRDKFLLWIQSRFDAYVTELLKPGSNDLRDKFRKKMDYISEK